MMTENKIVRALLDAVEQAGGVEGLRRVAADGPIDLDVAESDQLVLVEEYGSPADAMYAIQLEAQARVSALPQYRIEEAWEAAETAFGRDPASDAGGVRAWLRVVEVSGARS